MLLRALLLVVSTLLLAEPAQAQIYAWRDANGNLVVSDRKLDPNAATYSVPDAPNIRSTRPVLSGSGREQYDPLINEHATRHSLRPDLVRAVIQVESGFNPRARSPKGAMGLMQLMPATALEYGVSNPYDPDQNIGGGSAYLHDLLDRYNGNEELALAAYNAGPGAVERYGQQVPPYRETRDYVKRIGSATTVWRRANKLVIYKTVEIVNGQPIARYSSEKPPSGSYEVIVR
jgi:soluble lytic murein transglycosylase-like protein